MNYLKQNILHNRIWWVLAVCFSLFGIVSCGGKSDLTTPDYTNNPDQNQKGGDDQQNPPDKDEPQDPPTNGQTIPLADPYILLYDGTYYAYGTGGYLGFEVATSRTLKVWKRRQGKRTNGMALHKDDVWGDDKFWAPEVYYINDKFYMYYTCQERLCVAVSNSPLGPFKQVVDGPMFDEQAIDNTVFQDTDGKFYMYFDSFKGGMSIWVAELEPDLLHIKKSTMQKCLTRTQPWESVSEAKVIEGSFVFKRGSTYYMIYSANNFVHKNYGIGCATAQSPMGPWTKYSDNPLLQKPGKLVGTGHGAVFADRNGNTKLVFHAHKSISEVHPRQMYITDVNFSAGGKMTISDNYIVPTAAK